VQEVSGVYTSLFLDTDDLKMALRARKLFGAFEKRAPEEEINLMKENTHSEENQTRRKVRKNILQR